jgi:hypothetical protein
MTGTPDSPVEAALRAAGIVHPQWTASVAAGVGLGLAAACALLDMETSGGHNEFGHDPGNPIQGGPVTELRYKLMRHFAAEGHPSQGVGPCQLTSIGLLDAADAQGGAWAPIANMKVGFRFLFQLRHEFGDQGGFQHYNGSGPAAVSYGLRAVTLEARWEKLIGKAGD